MEVPEGVAVEHEEPNVAPNNQTHHLLLIDKLLHNLNKNISKIDNVAKESRNLVNKTTLTLNSGKFAHAALYSGNLSQFNLNADSSSPKPAYNLDPARISGLKVPSHLV